MHGSDPTVRVARSYGVGIDTHSKFIQVCVLKRMPDDVEYHMSEATFATTYDDLCRARKWTIDQIGTLLDKPDSFRYTIESTGCYHMPVLQSFGGIPSVVNPVLAGPTRRKTDVLDARLLAHHSVTGVWPESYIAPRDVIILRCFMAQWREERRAEIRCSNRINNHLLRFGQNLTEMGSVRGRKARAVVEDMLDGKVILPELNPNGIPNELHQWFRYQFEWIDHHQAKAEEFLAEAVKFVEGRRWPTGAGEMDGGGLLKALRTVPGVSETLALIWLAEVGDPTRFALARQVAAFAGCDPSLKVSAGKVTEHTKRKGNEKLHWHILKAAQGRLLAKDCPLGAWGRSIRGRHKKGGWNKAASAIARRMACALWQVHLRGEDYRPDLYSFTQRPVVPDMPIEQMGLGNRFATMLLSQEMATSQDVVTMYYNGLAHQKGIGTKCLDAIRSWINSNQIRPLPKHGSARQSLAIPDSTMQVSGSSEPSLVE